MPHARPIMQPPSLRTDFVGLRHGGGLYVDKTAGLRHLLAATPSPYGGEHRLDKTQVFMARPDGFGKTLLVDTMETWFQGLPPCARRRIARRPQHDGHARRLGLARMAVARAGRRRLARTPRLAPCGAAGHGPWGRTQPGLPGPPPWPDACGNSGMSGPSAAGAATPMRSVRRPDTSAGTLLMHLLERLCNVGGGAGAVVLVDNHDDALMRDLTDDERDGAVSILQKFYRRLKSAGEGSVHNLYGVFMTGVETPDVWINSPFSTPHVLYDMSKHFDLAACCGFTEAELAGPLTERAAAVLDEPEFVAGHPAEAWMETYGGHRFAGAQGEAVAHPQSLLRGP